MRSLLLSALALALTAAGASAQWGTIKGQVTFKGDPPKAAKLDVNKDQAHCLEKGPIYSERWVIDPKSKGVQWVVVWLAVDNNGKADHTAAMKIHPSLAAPPKEPLVIDQPCCRFEPHVSVLRLGQDFVIKNSAAIPHNSLIQGSNDVNLNPIIAPKAQIPIAASKWKAHYLPSQISCSIHPWMSAKLFVLAHPYFAVTDKDGNFEIKNAPAGKVRLLVWHEEAGWGAKEAGKFGKDGKGITVKAGETVDLGKIELKAD